MIYHVYSSSNKTLPSFFLKSIMQLFLGCHAILIEGQLTDINSISAVGGYTISVSISLLLFA